MTAHAQDIMSRELFAVSPEMSLIDMDKALSSRKISGAPVVSSGELIGIVTSTDIGRRFSSNLKTEAGETSYYWHSNGTMTNLIVGSETDAGDLVERLSRCTVADIMTDDVISVSPDDEIKVVASLMSKYKIHRILVVDDKRPVGMITSLDMVELLTQ